MSGDESEKEEAGDSPVVTSDVASAENQTDETTNEEQTKESLSLSSALKLEEEDKTRQNEDKELTEETESSSTPMTNEWEHLEVVSNNVHILITHT